MCKVGNMFNRIKRKFFMFVFLIVFPKVAIFATGGGINAEDLLFNSWDNFLNKHNQNPYETSAIEEKNALEDFIASIENFKQSDMYIAEVEETKDNEFSTSFYINQAQNHAVLALAFLEENNFPYYQQEYSSLVSAMNSFMILTIKQDRKYFIPFIQVLAAISFLLIASAISLCFYIENQKKIRLLEEKSRREQFMTSVITQVQENERNRISRDLHDTVTQDTRTSLLLVHKLQNMSDLTDEQKSLIQNIHSLEETNLKNIKTIIKNLTPPEIETANLEILLAEYVLSVKETIGIDCKFYAEKSRLYEKLSATQKLHIFRIVQESVNNAIKHANPSEISVIVREEKGRTGSKLVFITSDDGCGIKSTSFISFDEQILKSQKTSLENTTHLGILGMKNRAAIIGAEFSIKSSEETGTLIKLTLPVER